MIFALSGPSGIGKGYIAKSLKKAHPEIQEIVWYTTRQLRPDEMSGSNRKHVSDSEFDDMVEKGELTLAQTHFGHRYAVRRTDLLERPGIFLTELQPNNIEGAKAINPNIILIGLITDDIAFLMERLTDRRKTESEKEITERIASAKEEIELIKNCEEYDDYIVVSRENEGLIGEIALGIFENYYEGE